MSTTAQPGERKNKKLWIAAVSSVAVAGLVGAGVTYAMWVDDTNLGGVPGRFTYGVFEAGNDVNALQTPSTANEAITVALPASQTASAAYGTTLEVPVFIKARGQGNVDVFWSLNNSASNATGVFKDASVTVHQLSSGYDCKNVSFAVPPVYEGKLSDMKTSNINLLEAAKGENAPTGPTDTKSASQTLCLSISIPAYQPPTKEVTVQADSALGTATDQATATSEATPSTGGTASLTFNWGTNVQPYRTVSPTTTETASSTDTATDTPATPSETSTSASSSPSEATTTTAISSPSESVTEPAYDPSSTVDTQPAAG